LKREEIKWIIKGVLYEMKLLNNNNNSYVPSTMYVSPEEPEQAEDPVAEDSATEEPVTDDQVEKDMAEDIAESAE
jgi:hypothetical protein